MDRSMEIIMDKVCDIIDDTADKISRGGDPSVAELKEIGDMIGVKKNILKTDYLEGDKYSQAGDWEAMGRGRFGDYSRNYNDSGNSYANRGEHWVRGHYSRADGRGRGGYRRYSRDGGEDLMEHVDKMMDEAETEEERRLIKRFKKQLEEL